jgi:hypothetical protein
MVENNKEKTTLNVLKTTARKLHIFKYEQGLDSIDEVVNFLIDKYKENKEEQP